MPQISSFQILQGYPTSLTLNHWKNTTLFISGVREDSVAVKQDVAKCIYVIYLIYSVREGYIVYYNRKLIESTWEMTEM